MTVTLLLLVTVIIDKWTHKSKRVSKFYVIRENNDVLIISHEPIMLYFQNKEIFFTERKIAYQKVAHMLLNDKYKHINWVRSESFWINYCKENVWNISEKKSSPFRRLISVYFYWLNTKNWKEEQGISWYSIGNPTFKRAECSKDSFVSYFKGVVR